MRFRNCADVSAHRAFLLFEGWLSLRFVINRLILPLFGVCLTLGLSSQACAQLTPTPPPSARISAQNPSGFDPGAATQAWLDTVPADKRAKSDAYFEGGYWLILWNFLLIAAISIFLLASRISARLRDFAERAARFKPLQTTLYAIPYLLLVYILNFPLNLYEHFSRANEIPVKQVFEVDASRQTTRVSANVAGFLGTTRIALNDNLLKQCTLPEIREVMAHEMGHYVLNHGAKLLTYFGIFILIGFALARTLFETTVKRWGDKWGIRSIADPAGLPLLVLILSTFVFVVTPFLNTVVRVTEREADAFGINTSREPDGMAKVALKLGAYRKLDPSPLEEFIFFDHPSGRGRIRMAMDWKTANLPAGESATSETH